MSRRARRRLLGVAAVFCVVFLASCRAILGTDDYKDSVDILCGMLARCYDDNLDACRTAVDTELSGAPADVREEWIKTFSDRACFDRCASVRRCLNIPPVCSFGGCGRREDCCGFLEGQTGCNALTKQCCTRRGSRCNDTQECCPGAGQCVEGRCGGVACGIPGSPCSIDAQCCTEVCRDNVCAETICFKEGFECASDEDCCTGLVCNDGTCGIEVCSIEGESCADRPCCGDLTCSGGTCIGAGCFSDGAECSEHSQCCGKRCDFELDACRACSEAGTSCTTSGECCSGLCEGGLCSDCLPNGADCTAGGPKCCFGVCDDPSPGDAVPGTCTPTCAPTDCSHGVCVAGTPLNPSCSSCAERVCEEDPYCCCQEWDSYCVSEAIALCTNPCE